MFWLPADCLEIGIAVSNQCPSQTGVKYIISSISQYVQLKKQRGAEQDMRN